jgi:hypothetical protein
MLTRRCPRQDRGDQRCGKSCPTSLARWVGAVAEQLAQRLAKVVLATPAVDGVKMGALASKAQ